MQWDVFCRVIDNHGDLGVCWRLAAELGSRGEAVRLWVDDMSALAWMAPDGAAGVEVRHWAEPFEAPEPGDVVIEAFACDPPAGFVSRMAGRATPPVWINLEYLSAEAYVERSHGLPSPLQHGSGRGLVKWFFFPGFTPATGGLLRGPLPAADRGWLASAGVQPHAGERLVSMFAYADAPAADFFARMADQPTLLLLAAGASQPRAIEALRKQPHPNLRHVALPWLTQPGYDRLLAACDLNVARGEDSIVRAMWAGAPFVWHIYRQDDGVHERKLNALLDRMDADAGVRALWRAFNRLDPWPDRLPDDAPWRARCRRWRDSLLAQSDLTSRLLAFVASKR